MKNSTSLFAEYMAGNIESLIILKFIYELRTFHCSKFIIDKQSQDYFIKLENDR